MAASGAPVFNHGGPLGGFRLVRRLRWQVPASREVAAMMSYDDYKGENHGNWNQLVGRNNVVG
ncbi:hypothetical protein AB0C70_43340, partial [Streptomyces sp. NPDC048564]|uniref:hypothetical protein n=1 Tax=Streptomyces sp. NPDC048564 TaxID=3155760 RepID=UPI00342E08AC